jgi:hypothetical protein
LSRLHGRQSQVLPCVASRVLPGHLSNHAFHTALMRVCHSNPSARMVFRRLRTRRRVMGSLSHRLGGLCGGWPLLPCRPRDHRQVLTIAREPLADAILWCQGRLFGIPTVANDQWIDAQAQRTAPPGPPTTGASSIACRGWDWRTDGWGRGCQEPGNAVETPRKRCRNTP